MENRQRERRWVQEQVFSVLPDQSGHRSGGRKETVAISEDFSVGVLDPEKAGIRVIDSSKSKLPMQ
jgi:hypothetical protein